jgi:hypothetical protein
MEFTTKRIIDVQTFDRTVTETYGRPYSFQQQDDCKERQLVSFTVPDEYAEEEDYENDTVPEIVNHHEMGVSFKAWLERDPEQMLSSEDDKNSSSLGLWWDRNFYPSLGMVVNDLHSKGLIEAGEYSIDIDW